MEIFVFMFAANLGMKLQHFAASTAVQYVLLRAVIKGRVGTRISSGYCESEPVLEEKENQQKSVAVWFPVHLL